MKKIISRFLISASLFPTAALAVDEPPITSVQGVVTWVTAVVTLLQGIFWIVAVGSGLYAAFLYITARGSVEKVSQAQRQMIYTVIAAALAIMAYGLPALVKDFLSLT